VGPDQSTPELRGLEKPPQIFNLKEMNMVTLILTLLCLAYSGYFMMDAIFGED
jgi:hypothetical protein